MENEDKRLSFNIEIKSVSGIEFSNLEDLKQNIKLSILDDPRLIPKIDIDDIHGDIDKLQSVNRRKRPYNKIADAKIGYVDEGFNLLPAENILYMVLSIKDATLTSFILEKLKAFVVKCNLRKIRLGDNTTLGKGVCSCIVYSENNEIIPTEAEYAVYDTNKILQIECLSVDGIYATKKENTYCIPASTLKGLFRHRITEEISKLDLSPSLIDSMFGNHEKAIKGKIIFHDAYFSPQSQKEIDISRMHIDKFSGAAMSNGVYHRTCVKGNFTASIEILENFESYFPYIKLVIQDLNCHFISIGAGASIGKGFFDITHFNITDGKN